SPDLPQALAHAREADSRCGTAAGGCSDPAARVGSFEHAFAGVLDGQHGALGDGAAPALQTNEGRLAARVTRDVPEPFLDDAKQNQLCLGREPFEVGCDLELDGDAGAIGKTMDEI